MVEETSSVTLVLLELLKFFLLKLFYSFIYMKTTLCHDAMFVISLLDLLLCMMIFIDL